MVNKSMVGLIGIIFAVVGVILTFALAVRENVPLWGLIPTGLSVVAGLFIIAWSFGE